MDGVLIVNKPAGWTSHDVVAKARGILRTKKIGHSGTLDPPATGVLLLCVGRATRISDYLAAGEKEYLAKAVFGEATDTQDAEGKMLTEADASGLTRKALESALGDFRGKIKQIPPMVSAVHHEGRRLYELARKNEVVERQPREIEIHELELLDFQPGERARATLRAVTSKGTYVRTICHDLGERLGVGAHLAELTRLRVGRFRIEDAISLEELAALAEAGRVGEKMLSIGEALSHLPSCSVSDEDARIVLHGGRATVPEGMELDGGEEVLVLSPNGELLALAKLVQDGGAARLQPTKVLGAAETSEIGGP